MHLRPIVALASAAALAAPTLAQNLDLDKVGGAVGGPLTCPIEGLPNEPYVLLFDLIEQQTTFPALGITLDITDQFAFLAFSLPSFVGITDANGDATAATVIPNDPTFQAFTFSMQAIAGPGPYRVSNLIRVTPQLPRTFLPSRTAPALPILAGGAVQQDDGQVLMVGGSGPVAQRYASRIEEWELAGASFGVGLLSQTTSLADGRVLFTGGLDLTTGQPSDQAAVFDPQTQQTTTLTMLSARAGHGASLLPDGRVLVTGGSPNFDLSNPLTLLTGLLNSTELFDPATGTFSAGPNMLEARALHTSTTLTTGRVLLAGGISVLPVVNVPTVSSTSYLFNPANNSFGLPTLFTGSRMLHTATALDNGKVLLAGGITLDLTNFLQTGNVADLIVGTRDDCLVFTPGLFFGSFATVPGMQVGRAGAAITALPNGGALIAGGFQLAVDVANNTFVAAATETADLFSQGPDQLTPTGSMAEPRAFPIAVDLPDGTVMVLGGGPATSEIYQR